MSSGGGGGGGGGVPVLGTGLGRVLYGKVPCIMGNGHMRPHPLCGQND